MDSIVQSNKVNRKMLILSVIYIIFFDSYVFNNYDASLIVQVIKFSMIFFVLYFLSRDVVRVKNDLVAVLCVCISIMLCMIVNMDVLPGYFFKILSILFAYAFASKISLECFNKVFKRIFYYLVIASIVLYLFRLIGVPLGFLPVLQSAKTELYTIGVANIYTNDFGFLRNPGVFWEPGVYAAYIVSALIIDYLCNKKIDIRYFIVLTIALITTFSTTAYIVYVVFCAAILLERNSKLWIKIMLFSVLCAVVFIVFTNANIYNQLFYKFDVTSRSASFADRWNSIEGNLLLWKESPILGAGLTRSADFLYEFFIMKGQIKSFSNLNTILAGFSVFGIVYGAFYLFYLVKFNLKQSISTLSKVLFLLTFVLILSSTGFQFSVFFLVIFMLKGEMQYV